jgi:Flp pilus assembly protein TadD
MPALLSRPLEQARQLEPESWRPVWQVGAVWLEKREFERARGLLESATEMPGAGPEAFRALASASQNSGHFREALAAWRRAHELDPRDLEAPMQLAFLLATCPDPSLRNGAEALALAQQVARARPDDVAALDVLAAAQAEQGQWDEALATIRRAIAIAEQKRIPGLAVLRERESRYARQQPYRPGG